MRFPDSTCHLVVAVLDRLPHEVDTVRRSFQVRPDFGADRLRRLLLHRGDQLRLVGLDGLTQPTTPSN